MAGTYLRRPISGAADGKGVKVVATGSAGTTIHTAQASATLVDVVTLYATNTNTTVETVTLQWGGTTSVDDDIIVQVPAKATVPIAVDLILRNSLVAKAYSTTANVVSIHGFVNTES